MRPSANDELPLRRLCAAVVVAAAAAVVSVAAIPASNAGRQPKITAVRAKADAHVTAANRRTNFAHARRLAVDGRPITRVYVRFRLPNVNEPVRRVSLLVYTHTTSRLGYQVRLATRPWVERTITFANAPRPSSRFVSSGRLRDGAWKAVDVTSLLGALDKDVSFVLTTVGTRAIQLASRETGLHGPRLVIEYEDPRTTSTATTQPAPN
jgi:acid phosphatase type 7